MLTLAHKQGGEKSNGGEFPLSSIRRRARAAAAARRLWEGVGETKPLRGDESVLMRLKGYSGFIETTACGARCYRRDVKDDSLQDK